MNWLLDFILRKSYFPKVKNTDQELRKAALLRILLGVIISIRFAEVAYSLHINGSEEMLSPSIYILSLLFLFTIGLLTPVVTILLLASLRHYDSLAITSNLGTIILVSTLLVLFLLNHGQYYSIDNLILTGKSVFSKILRKIYSVFGTPSENDISRAYLLGFIIYAVISFGALLFHLMDDYWTDGVTIKSLLTNSYLGKQYIFFRWIDSSFPLLLSVISLSCGAIQSIFQFLMVPLIFLKYGKQFVMLWGMVFILTSLCFINLSYLPHVELIFWILIFFPAPSVKENLEIIFDDHLTSVKPVISFLKFINFNERYRFRPMFISREKLQNTESGESHENVFLTGRYKGKILTGFELFLTITYINPFLWMLTPLLYLLKVLRHGPIINKYLVTRTPISLPSEELTHLETIEPSGNNFVFGKYRRHFFNLVYNIYGVVLVLFIFFGFPHLKEKITNMFFATSEIPGNVMSAVAKIGLQVPGVFNRVDLSMGNFWLVLYKLNGTIWEIVPITGLDGSRLNFQGIDILYFSNHNSDVLYFGGTVGYRRSILDTPDLIQYHEAPQSYGRQHIEMIIKYDFKYNAHKKPVKYRIEVYGSHSSETELFSSDQSRHNPTLLYSKSYLMDGVKLSYL